MELIKLFLLGATGYLLAGLYDVAIVYDKPLVRKLLYVGFFLTAVPYPVIFFTWVSPFPGLVRIRLNIEDINFTKDFDIQGLETTTQNIVDFDITGNERVKSFGTSTFTIVKYENGQVVEANGQWQLKNNPDLFKILSADRNAITFEWVNGVCGELALSYQEGDRIETKTIKIEGLL